MKVFLSLVLLFGFCSAYAGENYYCTCPDSTKACKCYWSGSSGTPHFDPSSHQGDIWIGASATKYIYMNCQNPGFVYQPSSAYIGHSGNINCTFMRNDPGGSYSCTNWDPTSSSRAQMVYYACQPGTK